MGTPQIIVIILMAIGLGISVKEDDQPKAFILHLLSVGLTTGLLIWGGFFSNGC